MCLCHVMGGIHDESVKSGVMRAEMQAWRVSLVPLACSTVSNLHVWSFTLCFDCS